LPPPAARIVARLEQGQSRDDFLFAWQCERRPDDDLQRLMAVCLGATDGVTQGIDAELARDPRHASQHFEKHVGRRRPDGQHAALMCGVGQRHPTRVDSAESQGESAFRR
jgi:hypothetical protein